MYHSGTFNVYAFVYIVVNKKPYARSAGAILKRLNPSSSVRDVMNRARGKYIQKGSLTTVLYTGVPSSVEYRFEIEGMTEKLTY